MINYLKEVHKKAQDRKEYMLFNVPVYVINKFPKSINMNNILNQTSQKINKNFLNGLDAIYIGDFDDLNRRDIQSMFKDGAIWISSNNIKNIITEPLVVDSIIHEVAHLLEDRFEEGIYYDRTLENEYLAKKRRLYELLLSDGYKIPLELFFSDDYLKEFDQFLYKKVGYDKISIMTSGLFLSPYSITTIREYFAAGLLMYLSEDKEYLKIISPTLYLKIKDTLEKLNNEY